LRDDGVTPETAGRISGSVIQALRHPKQPNIDAQMLARLSARLFVRDKAAGRSAARAGSDRGHHARHRKREG
jgi:hypothetical protein